MDYGLAQLPMRTDHNKGGLRKDNVDGKREHQLKIISRLFEVMFYASKMPNRLTQVVPNLNPFGNKTIWVMNFHISFKSERHIMM